MIPNLAPPVFPGVMIPGQFGPINLTFVRLATYAAALTMSKVGIPSVIQTITPSPFTVSNAFAASIIASPANGGGT